MAARSNPRKPVRLLSYDMLNREDVAAAEPLSAWGSEIAAFVRVYFGDGQDAGPASQGPLSLAISSSRFPRSTSTDPETGKDGSQVVWVENSKTRKFVSVRVKDQASINSAQGAADGEDRDPRAGTDHDSEEASLLTPPVPLRGDAQYSHSDASHMHGSSKHASKFGLSSLPADGFSSGSGSGNQYLNGGINAAAAAESSTSTSSVALLTKVSFFLCQGLLAGFGFSTALVQEADRGLPIKFLLDYQPLASEYRRLFYILSALSAVGSSDTLMTTLSRANRPSLGHSGPGGFGSAMVAREARGSVPLAALAALLHLITFLLTVLMSAFDVLVSVKNGAAGKDQSSGTWATLALSQAGFAAAFKDWQSLETGRVVCAIIAWLLACLLVWRELLAVEGRGREILRIKDSLLAWKRRAQELGGDDAGLDELDVASLKRLLALQMVGAERTSAALRVQQELS